MITTATTEDALQPLKWITRKSLESLREHTRKTLRCCNQSIVGDSGYELDHKKIRKKPRTSYSHEQNTDINADTEGYADADRLSDGKDSTES